jgi:hypothetical protein
VYEIAHSREEIEEVIKTQLEKEKCPPGKYGRPPCATPAPPPPFPPSRRARAARRVTAWLVVTRRAGDRYYPFMSGKIKPDSPLGKLLTEKGVKF